MCHDVPDPCVYPANSDRPVEERHWGACGGWCCIFTVTDRQTYGTGGEILKYPGYQRLRYLYKMNIYKCFLFSL